MITTRLAAAFRFTSLSMAFSAVIMSGEAVAADDLAVVSTSPSRTLRASIESEIVVAFDQPVDPASIDGSSFSAFGKWSGPVSGTYSFANGDREVTLNPERPFSAGEVVTVMLSHNIRAANGDPLRAAGYAWTFWVASRRAANEFILSQNFSTRSGQNTRTYGGIGTDLNADGFLDITLTNEDTSDVRVFMNSADGEGMYNNFLQPPQPVGAVPSPCEPADFNGDGHVDMCIANTGGASVSILLGAGDGTWLSHTQIGVGSLPRGIAAFDADGDGDADVVNTNANSNNLSIIFNNGSGIFSAPTFFDAGVNQEWALAAADMNEDGILDLVVGARNGEQISILLGNGDGTFTFASSRSSGGRTWMVNCGDVNGDGHDDVVAANSQSNNGAILLGDGAGNLGPATTYVTDPFPLATDIGDLDGDGDLDWATSSFSGDWWIFENDGAGNFTFVEEINAPSAASCALMLDIDNDRDLDLAMIDEIADRLILYKNDGTRRTAAFASLEVVTGVLLAGDVSSVRGSDDERLRVRSGFGSTLVDLHHLEIVLHGATDVVSSSTLDVSVESFIDQPSGVCQVRLRDWTDGLFDQVGSFPIGAAEDVDEIAGVDAARYVDGGGAVDVSIKQIVFVPFLAFTFESSINWVDVTVNE